MPHSRKTYFERLRISLTWCFGLFIAILAIFGGNRLQAPLLGTVLLTLGGILAAVGAFGRMWCSLYIAGYKNKTLVTVGPYSLCRNPLYFFSFIGALGIGLSTGSFTIPLIIVCGFAVYYPLVVSDEEARMALLHGEYFHHYRQRTPAFFPRFSAFSEPAEYTVQPIIFRKDIGDSVWFIWIVCLLQLISTLRDLAFIPTFFTLY
jgi:protein-S-isoprenylcysteine O-methyltransferase Ste14